MLTLYNKEPQMTVSEMIIQLTEFQKRYGDIEVLITDGYECQGYRGNFEIIRWEEDGKNFVDIGIGGCRE